MKLLINFTLGFTTPALIVFAKLLIEHASNDWSGNSPLNVWPAIPTAYIFYGLVVVITVAVMHKDQRKPEFFALAGLLSGIPLFMFVEPTSSLFAGWLYIGFTVFGTGILVVFAAWLAVRNPSSEYSR